MTARPARRYAVIIISYAFVAILAACTHAPSVPRTPASQIGDGYPEKLDILEPGEQEVVVVINDNSKMVHAGMFAGDSLLDPAGSYEGTRRLDRHWPGSSLQDYLRFQLEDGPVVKVYRFTLSPEGFMQVKARADKTGATLPFFCAARVQNIISGITPFESVPDAWLISPAALANKLDAIIGSNRIAGACFWPNGTSCYPRTSGEARVDPGCVSAADPPGCH